MRWSRHHDDTSLGELMDGDAAAAGGTELPADQAGTTVPTDKTVPTDTADQTDTAVRLRPTMRMPSEPAPEDPAAQVDDEASGATDSFLDDEDYLPQERRGPGRLTIALVAALVLAVGVLGGVWVQKQLGTSTASAAGFGARQGAGGTGTGTGTRGYGGTGAAPGGTAQGRTTQGGTAQGGVPGSDPSTGAGGDTSGGAGTGTSTGGSGTAAVPAVVGTVTTTGTKSLVVTDLGGTRHTVTLTGATTVTTAYTHGALKTGDTVAVVGSAAADGSVTATTLTVR